jgi:hypothetical protein
MTSPSNHKRPLRAGDIATVADFAERAGGTIDFERGKGDDFDPNEVPLELVHLIPFARRWSFADIGAQTVFLEHLEQNAPCDIEAFLRGLGPHLEEIRRWFDRLRQTHDAGAWPAAAVAFLNTVEMYDLVKPPDPDLIERQKRKDEEHLRRRQQGDDLEASRVAMTRRDFAEVVRLLSPYESELDGADKCRLELARKRV